MAARSTPGSLIPTERIVQGIIEVRGRKVMLSSDLAALYGVSTKAFNQAVKRNAERFPADFMFQLTKDEAQALRSQSVTSNGRPGRGGMRYRPYAFSEHGAVMAASVLNSPRAVEVSVFIVRAFVRLSRITADQRQLALKLAELEGTVAAHDKALRAVIARLKEMIKPTASGKKPIGFGP
ncbi:ORF6N domain-containing protein [candidate division WOR-3 bacterium]|nr:ORF6N domain-containing protein [candidate division WOR-3 bacterium]